MSSVHVVAQGFNKQVDAYETARPSYPPQIVDRLISVVGLKPAASVVELGVGTGKFTRLLTPYKLNVIAVEPAAGMRTKFAQLFPDITLVDGTGESIPVESGTVDAILIAQAFHWFASEASLREFHRVLKPNGALGLIWNLEDRNAAPWVAKLRDLYEVHEAGSPQYRLMLWKHAFDTQFARDSFAPLSDEHLAHSIACTKSMVWQRVLSKSYIANLDPASAEALRQQIYAMLERDVPQFAPDAATEATVDYPYTTDIYWTFKL
eukprot:TRINITY_DN7335_c0_g1_i1.p1 TRINITY_DN7335_c0_g1~~TRINITY_DN7335_c0_g1_i1.p1  ORF type:complete len:264 (-),score=99.72 TRINITY_DN7335_c0_g1_i1:8-799(-)